jgi:predicted Zn-dependent protease with MMP-like domain
MSEPRSEHEGDYERLDEAWAAVDAGEPERALELTRGASEDLAETWVLRATAALDLGDLDGARAAAEEAEQRESDADDDLELQCIQAEIALREWDVETARAKLQRAASGPKSPYVLARQALVADLDGDFGRADRLLREAQKLDAASFPMPPRLSEREMDHAVRQAIAHLPETFRKALEQVAVIVEPMPTREVAGDDPTAVPPDVLGLFTGASLAERDLDAAELPPTIHVFQRNVERTCQSRDELVEQIRVTLYHELGHYLGFDEEGVADIGLE